MKHLPCLITIGLLACTLQAQKAAPSQDNGDPFVKNPADAAKQAANDFDWLQCVVTLDAYALDKNDAADLLGTERGSAARYRRVLELAKTGKARLEILESLTTKSGQRAVIESIDEVRYPVEFPPPATAKGVAMPSAWETRNVGDTFELEPVIQADGHTCDINLVPSHVHLAEFRDLPDAANGAVVSQPIFRTQKITTSIPVVSGEPCYLGTITPPTAEGVANGASPSEIWLTFLHVNLQGPPAAKVKPNVKKAEKPDEGPADAVELQYSCYSVDREAAREILVGSTSVAMPWERVKALLAEKKARLEHLSTIKTKSGQRASTEEIREMRYMAEYAPEHRQGSSEHTERTVTNHIGDKKNEAKPDPTSTSTSTETTTTTRTDATSELVPGLPTAFETRNGGVTVEVEPVVGPDFMSVDLNEQIQSTKLAGNLKVTGIATHYPAQPLFESAKVTTSQSVSFDLPILVSTLNPPGADGVNDRVDTGRTYLLFVRATMGEP